MSKPTHSTYNPDLPNLNGKGWAAMGMATKAWAKKQNLVLDDKPCGQYYRNVPLARKCGWIELYLIGDNETRLKLESELPPKNIQQQERQRYELQQPNHTSSQEGAYSPLYVQLWYCRRNGSTFRQAENK